VHRKFAGFLADGGATIAPGLKIQAGDKDVGEVTSTSSIELAGVEKTVALGYIRREIAPPGREVTIGGVKAAVISLPVAGVASVSKDVLEHHPA